MSDRLAMHVSNVIWLEAFDQYAQDCAGRLYDAPKKVQYEYRKAAAERIAQKLTHDLVLAPFHIDWSFLKKETITDAAVASKTTSQPR